MMRRVTPLLQRVGALTLAGFATSTAFGLDWNQFRGPDGSGVIPSAQLPKEWSAEKNLAWKTPIKGTGWSSPIVVDGSIFVTAAVFPDQPRPSGFRRGVSSMRTYRQDSEKMITETDFVLHSLRLEDGKLNWSRTVTTKKPAFTIHPSNTYATSSPATDGTHIFTYFAAAGVVAATTLDGKPAWERDLGAFPAGNGFGAGSSLMIGDGLLFLQCDNDEQSFAIALEPDSGETVWRVDRNSRTSWSTPILWENRFGKELILCGADTVTSLEPQTGKEIWKLTGFGGSFSSTPAFDSDRIYFGNSGPGSAGPLTTVEAGARGAVPYQKGQASKYSPWARTGSGPGLSSPVAYEGLLYISAGSGILSCYDTSTGDRLYKERLPNSGSVAASLWIADDQLYALDELGTTHIIQTGPEFKVARTNQIEDLFWSTPAVFNNTILMRGADFLYCVREESAL